MNENATEDFDMLTEDSTELFIHKLRPQWGPALLVLEEQTKRSYQFEDGQLRKVKEGFYHMMVPLEASAAKAEVLAEDLQELHQLVHIEQQEQEALMAQEPVMSFQDQLKIFAYLYPDGFQDPAFQDAWRAPTGKKQSKRHVDQALALASELLSKDHMTALIAAEDYESVHAGLLKVLKKTSLAAPSKVTRPLAGLSLEHKKSLALALHALLHGEASYKDRMRAWIIALGELPGVEVTWAVASLPSALLRPRKHALVKPTIYRLQARIVGHGAGVKKRPTPRGYAKARKLIKATRDALIAEGLAPRDLLDVRCFMWETLRPKGQELLGELGRRHIA